MWLGWKAAGEAPDGISASPTWLDQAKSPYNNLQGFSFKMECIVSFPGTREGDWPRGEKRA